MHLASDYAWPIPPGAINAPLWTDHGFVVDGVPRGVLTSFHEDTAGSSHPIDRASRTNALRQLGAHAADKDRLNILDAGCSSGFLLDLIRQRLPNALLIGADYGPVKELLPGFEDFRSSGRMAYSASIKRR